MDPCGKSGSSGASATAGAGAIYGYAKDRGFWGVVCILINSSLQIQAPRCGIFRLCRHTEQWRINDDNESVVRMQAKLCVRSLAHIWDVAVAHAMLESSQLDHPSVEAVVGGRFTQHDLWRLHDDSRHVLCQNNATAGETQSGNDSGEQLRHGCT